MDGHRFTERQKTREVEKTRNDQGPTEGRVAPRDKQTGLKKADTQKDEQERCGDKTPTENETVPEVEIHGVCV